ncbi:MAG TPA: two-component regulator propeller domain-containing protein, partial [Verrucomicrobiae bacterium]|nr:two-component regulator propeller domain-containing protein [Verrucomicrobiae bacterium]
MNLEFSFCNFAAVFAYVFRRRHLLLAILGIAFMTVSRPAPASDWLIDLWTSDDNLPDSSVTSLAQTPDGYLWIGTLNGLARFDGTRFASFTPSNTPALKHSQISGLFLDDAGTLWINTHDGSLTAYRHGRFHLEWTGGQVATLFSISNRVYFALKRGALVSAQRIENAYTNWQMIPLPGSATGTAFHEDNHGNLWCLLRNGSVERIIGTHCEPVARPPAAATHRPRFLATAPDGRILLGTADGILGWNGYEFVDETPTNGPPHPSVSYLFCATNGTWAFADGKVRKFVGRRWTEEVPDWNDLAAASPTYLGAQQDHRGYVWFRQFGLGVFYATPDGSVGRLATTNGLPGDRINCWLQDLDGNVWLGIDHGGLVRLRERQFKAITSAGSISSIAVSSVCEDTAGDLWLGTFNAGLIRWRNGQSQHFELGAGANHTSFFSVCPDSHDQLWLSAGREDLFLLRSNQIVPATPSLHGVKTILADHGGRVWFGRQSRL